MIGVHKTGKGIVCEVCGYNKYPVREGSQSYFCDTCHRRKERKTPKGKAKAAWNAMRGRVTEGPRLKECYRGVQIRMTREQFMEWAVPAFTKWIEEHPGVKSSVDRIEAAGHYELGNIRIISLSQNSRDTRRTKNTEKTKTQGKLWCSGCQAYLSEDLFYKLKRPGRSGRTNTGYCKECDKAKKRVNNVQFKRSKVPSPN
jgi:hypothetical protein